MSKIEVFNMADLGEKILKAQQIHEESYVQGDPAPGFGAFGSYAKDHMQSAIEACGADGFKAQLIYLLNVTCWNDIQEWAHHVQDLNYPWGNGRYTAPDGRCYEADGTEIVGDEIEKVEVDGKP